MASVDVYLVHHVRHAAFLDGRPTEHRGEDGELIWDEEDGDDLKFLGVFSTEAKAQRAIAYAQTQPGFRDEPDCFVVAEYTVDESHWNEGFVCVPR